MVGERQGGNMRYLHRQARKRKNPQAADPSARRAIVVLDNYYYDVTEDTARPKVARYARGQDYHAVTLRRLHLLADFLRHNGAKTARPYTDSGPLAERELAQRAGLGWIGKNTMLIRPGQGSWVFIGTVLTDLDLEIDKPLETDHCGSCTRCLEACPTPGVRCTPGARRDTLHLISHNRASRADPSRAGGPVRGLELWLRYLQRGLSLEYPFRFRVQRAGVSPSRRAWLRPAPSSLKSWMSRSSRPSSVIRLCSARGWIACAATGARPGLL